MWEWLRWARPPGLLHQVIVNQTDETAIRGVLWQARGPWLVLRSAAILKPHGDPVAVDGDVVIHRGAIRFIQVLP